MSRSRGGAFACLVLLLAVVALAQNPNATSSKIESLEGTWTSRLPGGGSQRPFTFHVTGPDSFSGIAAGEVKFTNGKFENGYFSFSGHEAYYTGFITPDHLEITEELHFNGYKAVRKANTPTGPNPLDGEWAFVPPRIDLQLKVNGEKLEGAFIDSELEQARAQHVSGVARYDGLPTKKPFLEGSVRGDEGWFKYTNRGGEPAQMMVKLASPDHLDITTDIRRQFIATKRAATPATAAEASPAARPALTLTGGKMAKYEAMAADAMAAVSQHNMERATNICSDLETAWDTAEDGLHKRDAETWNQIDRAMDAFIHPITRSGGQAPDAKALDAVYKSFVAKLKLAN